MTEAALVRRVLEELEEAMGLAGTAEAIIAARSARAAAQALL